MGRRGRGPGGIVLDSSDVIISKPLGDAGVDADAGMGEDMGEELA
jgi:hypothetical protein